MVCKKCGNELIEGIDICPYCGEPSNQEETPNLDIKNLMSDLGNLKFDIETDKKENEELAVTQDLENLKNEIKALEIHNDENNSFVEQDNFINQNVKKIEDNNEILSINDIASNIEEINKDENETNELEEISVPKTDLNLDTIDLSNYIDDNDNNNEKEAEILDLNFVDKNIEESNSNKTEGKNEKDEIKILPDEELYNNHEEIANTDIPDIQNLIHDIKNIPLEDTKNQEKSFDSIIEDNKSNENINTYDLIKDLKNVKVEGIQSISPQDDKKEENHINKESSPIKNDYLLKSDVKPIINQPTSISNVNLEDIKVNIDENQKSEEQKINNIEPLKIEKTEVNTVDLEKIDENKLRLKSDKLRIDDKEGKVYINENLNLNTNSSMVMMPNIEQTQTNTELLNNANTHIEENNVVNENVNNNEIKNQQKNFSTTMLFICMVVLGIVVVLVVSYVFNI